MRGGVLKYAAQATSQIDAEIGKKDHFWMETIYGPGRLSGWYPGRMAGKGTRGNAKGRDILVIISCTSYWWTASPSVAAAASKTASERVMCGRSAIDPETTAFS